MARHTMQQVEFYAGLLNAKLKPYGLEVVATSRYDYRALDLKPIGETYVLETLAAGTTGQVFEVVNALDTLLGRLQRQQAL